MWRKWKKQNEGCEKELKGCNLPLIWLALNHKGMLGNQCRLIATFTEPQKTQKLTVSWLNPVFFCSCICTYFSTSLPLCHTQSCSGGMFSLLGEYYTSAAELAKWRAMLELTLFDWLQCVCEWVCEGTTPCVWDRVRNKMQPLRFDSYLPHNSILFFTKHVYINTYLSYMWQILVLSWYSYPVWRTNMTIGREVI